jgi:osmotically-inducible protein OsmY
MRHPSPMAARPHPDRQTDRVVERVEEVIRLRTGGMIQGLRVEVGDGRVTLTGRTTSFYNKQLATHAALGALGGRSLSNLIEVN